MNYITSGRCERTHARTHAGGRSEVIAIVSTALGWAFAFGSQRRDPRRRPTSRLARRLRIPCDLGSSATGRQYQVVRT